MRLWILDFHALYALKVEIKTKKRFEYFSARAMDLEYMKVSEFVLYCGRKLHDILFF